MKKQILSRLNGLEKAEVVKVGYAIESGSRAWGFASTDSDWDVRFLYVRRPEWYFSVNVERRRDVLEHYLEFWMPLSQRFQHAVDEDRFAIEYVDVCIDYFTVHEQRQAHPGHRLEHALKPADIGNARCRMGRRASRVQLGRGENPVACAGE